MEENGEKGRRGGKERKGKGRRRVGSGRERRVSLNENAGYSPVRNRESWYCFQRVCLCVNKSKSGCEDMSYGVEHHITGC